MSRCVSPLDGWYSSTPTDLGRTGVTFRLRDGFADRPVSLPCGKCIGCLQDRAEAWSVRCYHEATLHPRNCFATFTYSEAPPSLVKSDLQNLFKRLRRDGQKFRYFACGEYGSKTLRPHYHVLFFGTDFRADSSPLGFSDSTYYFSPYLTSTWSLGHVTLASCDPGAIFYTAGYSLKSAGQPDAFHIASRRPPIGDRWLDKFADDAVRNGFVTIEGKKYPIPPAYLERKRHAVEFDQVRERRRLHIESLPVDHAFRARSALRSRETTLSQAAARRGGSV